MSEQNLDFVKSNPALEAALNQVRTNHEEAVQFAADPEAYLKAKGVDTTGLTMTASELSDADLEHVAGGVRDVEALGVCGGIGAGVCGSVGGDVMA